MRILALVIIVGGKLSFLFFLSSSFQGKARHTGRNHNNDDECFVRLDVLSFAHIPARRASPQSKIPRTNRRV